MKEQDRFDQIEAFLKGEMAEAEAQDFEGYIAGDEALAKEVAWHRMIREGLLLVAEAEEKKVVPLSPQRRNWPLMAVAAVVLLLLTTAPWWSSMVLQSPQKGISSQQHNSPGFTYSGESDKLDSLVNFFLSPILLQKDAQKELNAVVLANETSIQAINCIANMSQNIPLRLATALNLNSWLSKLPESKQDSLSLFAALVQLNANKLFEAGEYLDKSRNQHLSISKIDWYQMLVYLKTRETDKAEVLLQKILDNPKHEKYQDALVFGGV